MHIVQQSLPAVVAALLERHPMSPGKLTLAWHMAVGASLARASEVAFDEGRRRLLVTVADGHWQREIERAAPTICGRLDGLLGPGTVVGLDVRVVPASRSRTRGRSAGALANRSAGASAPAKGK